MLIKSFYGESMHEAMQSATRQLGEDALILNSRETPLELRSHGRFEVVATIEGPLGSRDEFLPLPPALAGPRQTAPSEVHVLVGLNGCGKTTCALKLAVRLGVWQGRKTAIVHFDMHRIARREALAWYGEAAGIACLDGAGFDRLQDFELLIVDTSGAPAKLPHWLESLAQHEGYSAHLVAPAWAGENYFRAAQPLATACRARYVLPTFLDDAQFGGDAAAAAAKLDLGVRFQSIGAKVPQGLEQLGAEKRTLPTSSTPSPAPSISRPITSRLATPSSVTEPPWAASESANLGEIGDQIALLLRGGSLPVPERNRARRVARGLVA